MPFGAICCASTMSSSARNPLASSAHSVIKNLLKSFGVSKVSWYSVAIPFAFQPIVESFKIVTSVFELLLILG